MNEQIQPEGGVTRACILYPALHITMRMKRVYPVDRLPYPGDGGPFHCERCLQGMVEMAMNSEVRE